MHDQALSSLKAEAPFVSTAARAVLPASVLRWAGLTGLAFVALSGVVLFVAPFWPPAGASAQAVVDFYRAHRLPFLIGNGLALAAAVPSFVQLGALIVLIKKAEGERGWLWAATLVAVIVAHAVGAIALLAYQAVPFELGPGHENVAKGLSDLGGVAFAGFLFIVAGFVLLTSWATWTTRVLPRALGHAGVPVAALCIVASLGGVITEPTWLAGGGLFSCLAAGAFFAWCGALSFVFLRAR
jgi:hypothetical protein